MNEAVLKGFYCLFWLEKDSRAIEIAAFAGQIPDCRR